MLRIYHIAKIEGKLLERILHIKKKKRRRKQQSNEYTSWLKSLQTHFTIIPPGTKDERSSKEARQGGQRMKDTSACRDQKKKKKKNRTSRPLSSRWRKERTTKRKKRRYSGDKDRSLTPHCFPFPFYWVTWRDPRSNFPPDSTTSSPFGPRCEKVIRVKLRPRPRIALRHDNTSVIAWQIFF